VKPRLPFHFEHLTIYRIPALSNEILTNSNRLLRLTNTDLEHIGLNCDALQTDELCPCNWQKGEKTLTAQCTMMGMK